MAVNDSAESADNANERATVGARVALGCAFLIAAGPTNHRISFAKRLSHQRAVRAMAVQHKNRRDRQSTSWTAFHNALGGLQPRRQSIWSGLLPPVRNGRQSPLRPFALEAQP